MKRWIIISAVSLFLVGQVYASEPDYRLYHQRIVKAEELIAGESYAGALQVYDEAFSTSKFVFLRDCQVATQLALYVGDIQRSFNYLRLGIRQGWDLRSIRKNKFLLPLQRDPQWKQVLNHYDSLHAIYQSRLDHDLRKEVHKMFKRDQWKAIGALFTFGSKAQDRYAESKFAPNSEKQVARLTEILNSHGYPGEKLIGNNYWVMTILSHHNSISEIYCQRDTMYPYLQARLLSAILKGEMSPFEYALIDNWFIAVGSGHTQKSYGYLDGLTETELVAANTMRSLIGLRRAETRNRLIDIQQQTGMNFYLPEWPGKNVKIEISDDNRAEGGQG